MAWVTSVEWVQTLAQELPHAVDKKKKKKKKNQKQNSKSSSELQKLPHLPYFVYVKDFTIYLLTEGRNFRCLKSSEVPPCLKDKVQTI